MKIKLTQFDEETRNCISYAVEKYASSLFPYEREERLKYFELSLKIRHGELLIGEYQYNEQEKGGQDEAGH